MTGEQDRVFGWNEVVRFRLPADWRPDVEEHEGHPVAVFHPPAPAGGVLRLVTDRVAPKDGPDGVTAVLHEMALRFVRPDDPRASDRKVEPWCSGGGVDGNGNESEDGVRAQAVMLTQEDGRAEVHYLWLVGAERAGMAAVAMFSYGLPAILDGDESCAGILALLDKAIASADIL